MALHIVRSLLVASGLIMTGSAHGRSVGAIASCSALTGHHISAETIGLPTGGASIETAGDQPSDLKYPAMCRVTGSILGASSAAPPIRFQVNLPKRWNGKVLQLGGGGLNGVLVDGLDNMPGKPSKADANANPLAKGFATFGSDGGHKANGPFDGSFATNEEARANYFGDSVKKVHDVAISLVQTFYGARPTRVYFAGGSKGGQEALLAAQRHGADYDGVIAFYPAKDPVALVLGWAKISDAAYGTNAGALSSVKQRLVHDAVLAACDGLDGLKDGIVANSSACSATISPATLRCTRGPASSGDESCLTNAEVAFLESGLQRNSLPFLLANNVGAIGPFPMLDGAAFDRVALSESGQSATVYDNFVKTTVGDFWGGTKAHPLDAGSIEKLKAAILRESAEADATSTNLDTFFSRSGKLIMVQGSIDMLVPPSATTDYFLRLSARYGVQSSLHIRYFIQPGYGHGNGDFDLSWDSLAALDDWVESGQFPASAIAVDANSDRSGREMPLCAYPSFPRYISGSDRKASSFRCAMQ